MGAGAPGVGAVELGVQVRGGELWRRHHPAFDGFEREGQVRFDLVDLVVLRYRAGCVIQIGARSPMLVRGGIGGVGGKVVDVGEGVEQDAGSPHEGLAVVDVDCTLGRADQVGQLPAARECLLDGDDERRPPRRGLQGGCPFVADVLLETSQPTGGDGVVLVGELGGDGGGEVPADPPPQG